MATLLDMAIFVGISVAMAAPLAADISCSGTRECLDALAKAFADSAWRDHAAAILGVWIALWWGYFTVSWGLVGATPGMWAVGLRVVDHKGRCPLGMSRAVLRLVAYIVSSTTLGVGHLLMLTRRDRRTLHDLLAGTRVVRKGDGRRETEDAPPAPPPESET